MPPRNIYLVGSVPLASTAQVFETVSAAFGKRIKQIPDGEVGDRSDWITHLEVLFREHPDFEPSAEIFAVHAHSVSRRRFRLRPGKRAADVHFGNLGYADCAGRSYRTFRQLRDVGTILDGVRFQVDLVPAHSVLWLFVAEDEQLALDPAYNGALKRELKRIVETIPHQDLAIQFDLASAVFARLERALPTPYGRTKQEMTDRFASIVADLCHEVPTDIPLLLHFCYGDANHRHAVEPSDMGDMVRMADALKHRITRPMDLIHMPVPRNRSDDAYFAPLKQLRLRPGTELCLGLVHYTDGIDGTIRRMQTALKCVSDFAVATECGFGRRDPATIPELLRIHVAASDFA
ncbi:MAG: hypothetical protein A3G25_21980 [Betaproteobacteria bacterium RIFCSPLOWO2_12_FULL_63_13]|nr:MAG: hypothetical protein A3G25_21980 [Betaproteobacteria bacterium RIFCSPLOWO2_12_FULL_63_13]